MANKILVGLDMFTINQQIIVTSEDQSIHITASVPVERIGETVAAFAQAYDVDTVNLFGVKDFITPVANDTKFYLNKTFSENNIVRIFVNGEIFN